ncbi:aminoacyl-tRNA hydrolase [Schizosaccharomyces cryophilus OY26]|uniref:peptidyl-tRNA hydrolase n=1 Tax=Schizosaccharomyces cryophilus (strain OY26 / ATCC MYA-4695 / CBS 11777 / NBRC 106824 / NRRL Y48691) TaxID=653667 RepID=S9X4A4_SCHCR|nr:aminoacyl-tRNA hydrolase [Schizosaccharomyces cryophilus OY26]EPY51892.1 aminoacyl-tRNA hydrolase [Schizosaccharomyces cryophilus OY26]
MSLINSVKNSFTASALSYFTTGVLVGTSCGIGAGKALTEESTSKSEKTNVLSGKEEDTSEGEESFTEEEDSEAELAAILKGKSSLAALALAEGQTKMVLVVRTDLGMTKGKIAAQCAHAALACYKLAAATDPELLQLWEVAGQAKITLQGQSEEQLQILQAQAMSLGLSARIVHDAGRTQIASGSATVLGIGPGPVSVINEVTGSLKLF